MGKRFAMHELVFDAREAAEAQEVLSTSAWQGDGKFCKRAEQKLSDLLGGGDALLTTNCTHAIEMAVVLPLAITLAFPPLSALAYRNLSR